MIGKKSISHLEVILSFVIFIGFLIFLFAVFQISSPVKSSAGLNALENGIFNYTTTSVDYFSVNIDGKKTPTCFYFFVDFYLNNISVRNKDGDRVDAFVDGSIIYIKGKEKDKDGNIFYRIYSSDNFEQNINENDINKGCKDLDEDEVDYAVGYLNEYEVLSAEKLAELNDSYNKAYTQLHDKFNIPKSENFGFSLKTLNGEEIMQDMKKPGRSVMAREIHVEIVNKSGDFRYAVLNIQTW